MNSLFVISSFFLIQTIVFFPKTLSGSRVRSVFLSRWVKVELVCFQESLCADHDVEMQM